MDFNARAFLTDASDVISGEALATWIAFSRLRGTSDGFHSTGDVIDIESEGLKWKSPRCFIQSFGGREDGFLLAELFRHPGF